MRINYYLNNKKSKETDIYAVLTYEGNKLKISLTSLGCPKVAPKEWNDNKQRPRGNNSNIIKQYIEKFDRIGNSVYHDMNIKFGIPEKQKLKQYIIYKYSGKDIFQKCSFVEHLETYTETRKARDLEKGVETYKNYFNAKHQFNFFLRHTGNKYDFQNLTDSVMQEFKEYLFDMGYNPNYIRRVMNNISLMYKEAHKSGITMYDHYKLFDVKGLSVPPIEEIYHTKQELEILRHLRLDDKHLDGIRDNYLIQNATALRISGRRRLSEDCLKETEKGDLYFSVPTKKTDIRLSIPTTEVVREILEKRDYKLPVMPSDQEYNRALKKIGLMAQITQPFQQTIRKGRNTEIRTVRRCDVMHSHTGRRTYATLGVIDGIPIPLLMAVTGHKKVASFQRYIRMSQHEAAMRIVEHSKKTGNLRIA